MYRRLLAASFVVGLSACATNQTLYQWGTYQKDLLSYSKNPGESKKFSAALLVNIQSAEAVHKVPPGLYAEYGYTLLDAGDTKGAVEYFGKERDRWPESALLMTKVINKLEKAPVAASETPAVAISARTQTGGAGQ